MQRSSWTPRTMMTKVSRRSQNQLTKLMTQPLLSIKYGKKITRTGTPRQRSVQRQVKPNLLSLLDNVSDVLKDKMKTYDEWMGIQNDLGIIELLQLVRTTMYSGTATNKSKPSIWATPSILKHSKTERKCISCSVASQVPVSLVSMQNLQ